MDTNERLQRLEKKIDLLFQEKEQTQTMADNKAMDAMGRITIPKSFRKVLGVESSSAEFEILLKGREIILRLKD